MMPDEKKGQCQGIPRPALDKNMLHCMGAVWVVYGTAFSLCSGRCLPEQRISMAGVRYPFTEKLES